jgi:hypothetical protein
MKSQSLLMSIALTPSQQILQLSFRNNMNYEIGNKKWNESANYRLLISAMSKVRWLVSHGRHKRPDGAQDVKLLMERLGKYANEEFGVDYVTQLYSVSEFVGLSVQELRYLADVGEWIEIDRKTTEMDDTEYEQFWEVDSNSPSMKVLYSSMPKPLSDDAFEEVRSLNQLFYR